MGLDGSTDAAAMGIDRYRRTDDKYGVCTAQPMILMHPTRHAKEPYGVNLTGKGVFEDQSGGPENGGVCLSYAWGAISSHASPQRDGDTSKAPISPYHMQRHKPSQQARHPCA